MLPTADDTSSSPEARRERVTLYERRLALASAASSSPQRLQEHQKPGGTRSPSSQTHAFESLEPHALHDAALTGNSSPRPEMKVTPPGPTDQQLMMTPPRASWTPATATHGVPVTPPALPSASPLRPCSRTRIDSSPISRGLLRIDSSPQSRVSSTLLSPPHGGSPLRSSTLSQDSATVSQPSAIGAREVCSSPGYNSVSSSPLTQSFPKLAKLGFLDAPTLNNVSSQVPSTSLIGGHQSCDRHRGHMPDSSGAGDFVYQPTPVQLLPPPRVLRHSASTNSLKAKTSKLFSRVSSRVRQLTSKSSSLSPDSSPGLVIARHQRVQSAASIVDSSYRHSSVARGSMDDLLADIQSSPEGRTAQPSHYLAELEPATPTTAHRPRPSLPVTVLDQLPSPLLLTSTPTCAAGSQQVREPSTDSSSIFRTSIDSSSLVAEDGSMARRWSRAASGSDHIGNRSKAAERDIPSSPMAVAGDDQDRASVKSEDPSDTDLSLNSIIDGVTGSVSSSSPQRTPLERISIGSADCTLPAGAAAQRKRSSFRVANAKASTNMKLEKQNVQQPAEGSSSSLLGTPLAKAHDFGVRATNSEEYLLSDEVSGTSFELVGLPSCATGESSVSTDQGLANGEGKSQIPSPTPGTTACPPDRWCISPSHSHDRPLVATQQYPGRDCLDVAQSQGQINSVRNPIGRASASPTDLNDDLTAALGTTGGARLTPIRLSGTESAFSSWSSEASPLAVAVDAAAGVTAAQAAVAATSSRMPKPDGNWI